MQEQFLPSIWSASPCALPYSNRMASFEKSKRFQFNSIYYKDDPFKPKKQQSPLSRPQMILNQFRKKIKQATKSHHVSGFMKRKKKDDSDDKKYQTINLKASEVTSRLYDSPPSHLQLKYDLNGNRSSFFQSENNNEKISKVNQRSLSPKDLKNLKMQHKDSDNIYITSTPRIDFSRPLNFNPGPGSYALPHDQKQKLDLKKMSGKLMVNSFDGKSSTLSRSVFDDRSIISDKKSQGVNKFATIDSNQLFKQRRNLMFLKRNEKQKELKNHY